MEDHLERRHVLVLEVADGSGQTSICSYRVLPESIADVTSLDSGGARVAIVLPGRDPLTLNVTQSAQAIREVMTRADELDSVGRTLHTHRSL
jgi:hypothetical protein